MEYQEWVGTSSPVQSVIITKEQIMLFLQGFPEIFRTNASRIPFTFPIVLWQNVSLPWLENHGKVMIHGQQSFTYHREITYTEELFYQIRLANVRQTNSAKGMHLLDCVMNVTDTLEQPVLVSNTTLLLLDQPESPVQCPVIEQEHLSLPPQIHHIWDKKSSLAPGITLFDARIGTITGDMLLAYAEASNDNNEIHLDNQKANEAGSPRRIAQGMLILGIICNVLQELQTDALALDSVKCRFHGPILEGDTIRVIVRVESATWTTARPTLGCTLEVYIENLANPELSNLVYSGSTVYSPV